MQPKYVDPQDQDLQNRTQKKTAPQLARPNCNQISFHDPRNPRSFGRISLILNHLLG